MNMRDDSIETCPKQHLVLWTYLSASGQSDRPKIHAWISHILGPFLKWNDISKLCTCAKTYSNRINFTRKQNKRPSQIPCPFRPSEPKVSSWEVVQRPSPAPTTPARPHWVRPVRRGGCGRSADPTWTRAPFQAAPGVVSWQVGGVLMPPCQDGGVRAIENFDNPIDFKITIKMKEICFTSFHS